MGFPDMWSETCLVAVARQASSDVSFAPITETIDIDDGNNPVDFIANVKGGRIVKQLPREKTTITMEMYPLGVMAPNGLDQYFMGDITDVSTPISVISTRTRYKFRVAVLWTDDTSAVLASSATAAGTSAYRYVIADAWLVGYKKHFTDSGLKATVTFEVPPFDKTGAGNIRAEECENGAIPALASYTSTLKFV